MVEEGCRKASEVHLGAAALNFVGADAAARYALEWDEQSSMRCGLFVVWEERAYEIIFTIEKGYPGGI